MKQQAKIVAQNVLSSYPNLREGAFLRQCFIQLGFSPATKIGLFFKGLDSGQLPNISTLLKYRVDFIKKLKQ